MNKTAALLLVAMFAVIYLTGIPHATAQTDTESLPEVTLTTPDSVDHIKYLGLKSKTGEPFTLRDIDADILMIELFSMYCPYCQKAAPVVNELYELLEKKKTPDMKLVIIGIGANNTDLEVDTFRKGFDIPFPMFSDPDLSIYKALAGAGTPTFIGCKRDAENNQLIFFRKSGGFRDAPLFLNNLLRQSREVEAP